MRVGLVGCGRIALEGHLPAYALGGVPVSAVCDADAEKARRVAEEFGTAYEPNAGAVAARDDVDMIDVATRPHGRLDLLRSLLPFGKPLLVQKPVAYDVDEARQFAEEARRAGVVVAINQNARWAPTHRRLRGWVDDDDLGRVYSVTHFNRYNEDLRAWYTDHPDYLFVDHGIHYLDLVRWLTKRTPSAVSAVGWQKTGQRAGCNLLYAMTLAFEGEPSLVSTMSFNNAAPAPGGFYYRIDVDGESASAGASLERAWLVSAEGEVLVDEKVDGSWVPHGILGAFDALSDAVTAGTEPPHGIEDHLVSLALADAAARSASAAGAWQPVR